MFQCASRAQASLVPKADKLLTEAMNRAQAHVGAS
jgi:hypothetical protein